MGYFKVTKKQSGGGTTVLKGTSNPTSQQGSNGDIFLKYGLKGALLHFEDSATADECGNTWTTYSAATISSSKSKFGSKSLYLDGNGSFIQTDAGDIKFEDKDFTISCWIYPLSNGRQALFAMDRDCRIGTDIFFNQGSANMWLSSDGNWNQIQSDNAGASNSGVGTIAINANEWTHIAYTRQGQYCRMFVNGQLAKETSLSSADVSVYFTDNSFRIGVWGGGGMSYNGYIDEFLVVIGKALYTSSFTPPSQPYSMSDFDMVLDSFAKINGTWQELIGSDIDDITTN